MQISPATLTANPFFNQLTANAIAVWLIQSLKNSKWFPLLSADTAALNRIVSALLAGVAAAGVHVSAIHQQQGVWIITLSGLTVAGVSAYLWHWVGSFAIQHGMYKMAVSPAIPVAATPIVK